MDGGRIMFRAYVLIAALLLMGVGYAQPLDTSRDNPIASTKDTNRPEGGYLSGTSFGLKNKFVAPKADHRERSAG